jgi:hypothetical protein
MEACHKGDFTTVAGTIGGLEKALNPYERPPELDSKQFDNEVAELGTLSKAYEHHKLNVLKAIAKLSNKDEDRQKVTAFLKNSVKHGLKKKLEDIEKTDAGPKRNRKVDEAIETVENYIDDVKQSKTTYLTRYKSFLKYLHSELKKLVQ